MYRPNNSLTSPLQQIPNAQYNYPVRSLPNEQQIRYGSERPMSSTMQQYFQQQQQQPYSQTDSRYTPMPSQPQVTQRNLPNEYVPRFGSERPLSSVNMTTNNQYNGIANRLNSSNNEPLSPIKQPPHHHLRQASLSELDEINYNTNKQLIEHQQQQQIAQQVALRADDLYGKVNPNRLANNLRPNLMDDRTSILNQQYKTLPSRNGLSQPISKFIYNSY